MYKTCAIVYMCSKHNDICCPPHAKLVRMGNRKLIWTGLFLHSHETRELKLASKLNVEYTSVFACSYVFVKFKLSVTVLILCD